MMGIGQGPAPERVPKTRGQTAADILGAASLPMSAVPIAGDLTGLAADAAMYAAYPEERTIGNYAMSALGVLPFVPGVAAVRAARGASPLEGAMDMSQAARMQRAAEQGFDVNMPVYHGSNANIKKFLKSKIGARDPGFFGSGFYFTPSKDSAMDYAESAANADRRGNPNVTEAFLGLKKPFIWDMSDDGADATRSALSELGIKRYSVRGDSASLSNNDEIRKFNQGLRARGYDGVIVRDEDGVREYVVFDPANIRSVNAAFDPTKRGSANLMAGAAGATIGLSALRNIQRDEEPQPD
jgi:hypothetical protein